MAPRKRSDPKKLMQERQKIIQSMETAASVSEIYVTHTITPEGPHGSRPDQA